jgi:hypothetical protein
MSILSSLYFYFQVFLLKNHVELRCSSHSRTHIRTQCKHWRVPMLPRAILCRTLANGPWCLPPSFFFHQKRWFNVALFFIYVTICHRNMTSPKRDQVHTRAWSGRQSECFALLVKNLLGGSLVCKASGTYRVECCVLLCHPWIPLLVSHAIAGGFPTLPHAISSETLSTGPSDVYRPYLSIKNGVACLCYICVRNMAKSKRRTILYENLDDVLDVGVLIYI